MFVLRGSSAEDEVHEVGTHSRELICRRKRSMLARDEKKEARGKEILWREELAVVWAYSFGWRQGKGLREEERWDGVEGRLQGRRSPFGEGENRVDLCRCLHPQSAFGRHRGLGRGCLQQSRVVKRQIKRKERHRQRLIRRKKSDSSNAFEPKPKTYQREVRFVGRQVKDRYSSSSQRHRQVLHNTDRS